METLITLKIDESKSNIRRAEHLERQNKILKLKLEEGRSKNKKTPEISETVRNDDIPRLEFR